LNDILPGASSRGFDSGLIQELAGNNVAAMTFFLVDLEFREKARQLITSKEMWFAIFFAVFALVSWSEVLHLLEYGGILPKSGDPYAALNAQQDLNPGDDPHCNPKFPKTCGAGED